MKKIVRLTEADLTRLVKRVIRESEMNDYDDHFFYKWSPSQKYYYDKNDRTGPSDEEFGEPDIEWWHPEDFEKFSDKYPYGEKQNTFPHPKGPRGDNNGGGHHWFKGIADRFGGKFPVFKPKRK